MNNKRPLESSSPAAEESAKKPKVVYGVGALLPPEVPIAFAPTNAPDPPVLGALPVPSAPPPADDGADVTPLAADDDDKDKDDKEKDDMDTSEESVVEKVQLLLMDAVEELSIVSRTLERWTVFAPSVGVSEDQRKAEQMRYDEAVKKGKQRIIEHLRKALRKFRRLSDCTKDSETFDSADLPVDLIAHVDSFLSPNTWLRALYDEIEYQNAVARGELEALASFHATLKFYVNVLDNLGGAQKVRVPDFTEASLPPTAARKPVRKCDQAVDLVHVLTLLKGPLAPSDLGSELHIRHP
eukprot:Gregarina_sp_Pseudo_9__5875@NODE_919_length_2062_cov_23_084034_g862_i0_p1_GENE_NODE_919_length_2062_cov_23_084034_g862_i0NODE_919_length_2062_cov_23_084034_g862_i0_p1_ORF_typecomplete_len297_score69_12Med10/PF09748_9/2_5e08RRS1/PF04939_12/1_3e03RRS1/PF04939_12/0_47_NODE_919_length_2062_cov_23_084034_g862_i066956